MRTSLSLLGATLLVSLSGIAQAQPAPKTPTKPRPTKPAAPAQPAAPPAPPSLADTLSGDARADYDAARLLYENADYAGALVKFTAAFDKSKNPRLLWNIAACEKNLRHYSNLRKYLQRYLAEGYDVLTASEKAEAESFLKAIEPMTASLELTVSEDNAKIFIDDAFVGESPLKEPLVVDVGPRKLRIEKDGFEPYREDLTVGDSPQLKLAARLEAVKREGTLVVYTARPLDAIFVDGTLRGAGTWRGSVSSGPHVVRVSAPQMRTYESEVFLREKETRTVAITLDREPTTKTSAIPKWVWIAGGALVVASGSVAGYFILKPEDKQPTQPIGTLEPGSVQASFPVFSR